MFVSGVGGMVGIVVFGGLCRLDTQIAMRGTLKPTYKGDGRDTGCGMRDAGCGIRDAGYDMSCEPLDARLGWHLSSC